MSKNGRVLRIEKCSIHDGDGLRTVVFLKGCPMRCQWCSTPESQEFSCGGGFGRDMTSAEVVDEIAKDEIFFFHSGGGVTLSGGEPLMQPEFCRDVLSACRAKGIGTAIETSAFAEYSAFEMVMPFLDIIYADVKIMDGHDHIRLCEVSNEVILGNIRRLSAEFGGKLRIRTPLIPTINMGDSQIKEIAGFCGRLPRLDYAELLPYHRLGIESYRKLGRDYALAEISPPDADEMEKARAAFARFAPEVEVR